MHLPQTKAPTRRRATSLILVVFLAAVATLGASIVALSESDAGLAALPIHDAANKGTSERQEIANRYGKLPLSFAANLGQADKRVRFTSQGHGYSLFLTTDGAALALRAGTTTLAEEGSEPYASHFLRMKLIGANSRTKISGQDELPGKLNYFIGNNARKWRKNIPTYASVRYRNAYQGIDLVYHGNQQQLEYDFIVAPGASANRIRIAFDGMQKAGIDADGNLVLSTAVGEVCQKKPIAYQEFNGGRREVAVNYKLDGNKVTFETGAYDKNRPLIIDPVLVYSTFLGGTGAEQGLGIAVDAQGSAYLTGSTTSTDFPLAGAFQNAKGSFNDAFVVKLNSAGTALVYATYLGGNGDDVGNAIAIDAQGSAYVVGNTGSGSFPRTVGVVQDTKDGLLDGFVTKLSASGSSLEYSTFLGGQNTDSAFGVAVDASGRAHVTGRTDSTRFRIPFPTPRNGSPVHKTSDSAGQWVPSSTDLTGSTVNAFGLDPSNSNTLYAGANSGVFKSVDAGAHWSLTGVTRPSTAPTFTLAVAVDPSNSSIIYAVGSGGIFKSINGGSLYDLKNNGIPTNFVNSLAIDPITPTTLYAAALQGMFKSTNGGDTWVTLSNGIPSFIRVNEIAIDPTNPAIVYIGTADSGMFKTTNGGALWSQINSGFNTFGSPQISALAIDPVNPSTVYAGTSFFDRDGNVLFKTTNGGSTWVGMSQGLTLTIGGQPFIPSVNAIAVDPVTPAKVYLGTSPGGIFKSTNGGTNWNQSISGFPNNTATALAVNFNNPAVLYAGTAIGGDAFAVRLNAGATAFEYLINFGGNENDEARGVALDPGGQAYLVGTTSSQNFPALNSLQPALGGFSDAFVAKLNSSGTGFVYSTYLGGLSSEQGRAIAVQGGSAYVTGQTSSADFPLANPFKASLGEFDVDAFVTKFNPSGASLDFSTYLGGLAQEQGFGIAVGGDGSVYVTGLTNSQDFPTLLAPQPTPPGFGNDAFVTKLNSTGTALVYSTYLGGISSDQGNGIAVDAAGNAYVIGTTSSADFPTASPLQPALKGTNDAFVAKIGVVADLSINKTDSRDPVMVNNPLSYTLKVTNNGPSPATGVLVIDSLPAGLTFGSASATQGSCNFNSGTVTCDVGALAAFANATIVITVTPTTVTTVSNTANVSANEPDINGANNSVTESTKISSLPSINGHVKDPSGVGISGVSVTLSGTQSASTQTDSNGFYQFAELPSGGNFVVTPNNANLSFNPPSQTFNGLNADQTGDFVASTCTFSIAPTIQSFSSSGGSGSVDVTSLQGCPWTAVSSSDWITITSNASGVGNGTVNFTVAASTAPRSGHLTIAGRNLAIYQEFNSCGTPTFSVANYDIQDFPNTVRIADLNGDGLKDVMETDVGAISGGGGIVITVLLNNASGVFTPSVVDTGLGGLIGLALADFNGDNRPDVAVTGFTLKFVRIILNNGNGSFGPSHIDVPITGGPDRGLFASDLNGDGKTDLVVSAFNTGIAQVLLGNGNVGFSQTDVNIGTNFAINDIVDLNNDQKPDLLLRGSSELQPIAVAPGNGSGGFGAPIISTGVLGIGSATAIGDFNSDGILDLAAAAAVLNPSNTVVQSVVVMVGDGTGHFARKSTFNGNGFSGMTAADLNSDGKLDLAFTQGDNQVTALLGDGTGEMGNPILITTVSETFGGGNSGIGADDLLGDAKPELVVANFSHPSAILRNTCSAAPSISGRIKDSRTTRGVDGVSVVLESTSFATTTDAHGNYFIGNLTPGQNYIVTPTKENFRFNPVKINVDNLSGTQTANFVGTPITVQFTKNIYLVQENTPSIQIDISRTGDLSGFTTVDYSTVPGTASDRSDFTASSGTLSFGPGEALKSFTVLVTDDSLVEGFESLRLVLSNPTGAIFNTPMNGPPFDVLMEVQDNDFGNPPNPIDTNTTFFVRQHYHDFLNREPDAAGLQFWVDQIEVCGSNASCRELKRINVSAAFFLSIEFQETGYFAYRMFNAAYGDTTSPNVSGTVPIIRLNEFLPDTQQIGFGVQVGIGNWQQKLEDNKTAYALAFVQRQRFIAAFPLNMTANEFVTKLDQNTAGVLSPAEKSELEALLGTTPADPQKRASVVRKVAEDSDLKQRELNRAFVLTQYYGYLRRNPDDPQDADFRGWKFWLGKLDQFNGNFVQAEMVKAFLDSGEYRHRFGL